MSKQTLNLTPELYAYLQQHSLREDELLQQLRTETANLPHAVMQIAPEQGQFMALLAALMNAKRALEIGVYTGYSSLSVARALPPDGQLIACDIDAQWTAIAQRYWQRAGVAHKIELRLAPALNTLDALLRDGAAGQFDLAFIDADKENYPNYYERCLQLVRAGGLILLDNTLWSGAVADPAQTDPDTLAIRALNAMLLQDARIDLSLLPIADGLTLARKRG